MRTFNKPEGRGSSLAYDHKEIGTRPSTELVVGLGKPPSLPSFVADIYTGNIPLNVIFTNTSEITEGTKFTWDFGDGSPRSQSFHAGHVYSRGGTFYVNLIASNKFGSVSARALITVLTPFLITESGDPLITEDNLNFITE